MHLKTLGGNRDPPGGIRSKKTLIKYCNQWWPLYKLEGGKKWPENVSLNHDTMLESMLFLRREGKWDEVIYAEMFFTLREHPEWQEECGINTAPKAPFVLTLERENKKRGVGKRRRCCSSCSIGQRCLKYKRGGGR